jgi:hypothetical protein
MTVSRIVSGPTHETALAAGRLGTTPESGIFSVTHETALIQVAHGRQVIIAVGGGD